VGAAIHIVASNIGTNTPLPANQPIELAFDRLLLPITVTRQTFELSDNANPPNFVTCSIAYDPVARVVTLSPTIPAQLMVGTTYVLSVLSYSDTTNPNGLHAIDGATMDPDVKTYPRTITFPVVAASATPPVTCNGIVGPCMSFCTDIVPIVNAGGAQGCSGSSVCHNGTLFAHGGSIAAGLALTGPPMSETVAGKTIPSIAQFILGTAINRLSIESTQGALSEPGPPSSHFGQDMPIIDTTTVVDPAMGGPLGPSGSGDPGNSYLIYKVLMAGSGGSLPTGAAPLPSVYSFTWAPLSDVERATLASMIPGREMPLFSTNLDLYPNPNGLPVDSLERLSLWMAQGAPLASCP
jgi:hypothetical protein